MSSDLFITGVITDLIRQSEILLTISYKIQFSRIEELHCYAK